MIKQRPTIQVVLPPIAQPGDALEAEVVLSVSAPVPVNRIVCALRGHERVELDGADGQIALCNEEVVLLEEGSLPAGETRLSAVFQLPADLPPSYQRAASGITIGYRVHVAVDIPWWPDAEESSELCVTLPPRRAPAVGPKFHRCHRDTPSGRGSYVEIGLSSDQLVAGDAVEGELALGNVRQNHYDSARLGIASTELMFAAGAELEARGRAVRTEFDISKLEEGQTLPFRVTLPDDLTPSFSSALCTLTWCFEATLRIDDEPALVARIPVSVLPPHSTRTPAEEAEPLLVGGERLTKIWADVAEELQMHLDAGETTLRVTVDRVDLVVRRENRGSVGRRLVAELRFPSLGVAAAFDESTWRHAKITSREPGQIEGFVAGIAPTLVGLHITACDDERLVVVRDEPGNDYAPLVEFCSDAIALAGALTPAASAITPPRCMASALDGWQSVTQRLRGELREGDMSITGRLDGAEAYIATQWQPDGAPLRTRFEYRPQSMIPESRTFACSRDRFVEDGADDFDMKVRARIDQLLQHAERLVVKPDRIVLMDERAPMTDAEQLLERLEELSRLAAALRGKSGPYR